MVRYAIGGPQHVDAQVAGAYYMKPEFFRHVCELTFAFQNEEPDMRKSCLCFRNEFPQKSRFAALRAPHGQDMMRQRPQVQAVWVSSLHDVPNRCIARK